jgi:hypothetical protein
MNATPLWDWSKKHDDQSSDDDFPHEGKPPDGDDEVRRLLPRVDWHELWAQEDDTEEWIIFPLLPARRLVALYSPPKVGKSLLMLEVAAAVATGCPVLGWTPTQPRRVLYVDFENDPKADIRERLQDMAYGPDDLENLVLLSFPTLGWLDTATGGAELLAAAIAYEAEVVIIDTVSRAVRGEENENDTWLNFYRHTGLALKQHQIACMRLDHAGKDVTKGQRGGSAKSGDVDAVWQMTRLADDTIHLKAEALRFSLAPGWQHLVVRRGGDPFSHTVTSVSALTVLADKAVALLDKLAVPTDLGRGKVRKDWLEPAGESISNVPLSEAIAFRRCRISPYMPVPDRSDNEDQLSGPGQDGTA